METPLASSPDPRSQKKIRRRDDEPPDPPPPSQMECDDPVAARKLLSYKDIVVGPNDPSHGSKSVSFDDDDIELLEDDIAFGSENGVPTIDFSERVQTLALQSMDLTLVVKIVEYESLPTVCFHCGHYGHLKDICPKLLCPDEISVAVSETTPPLPAPAPSVPDEAFGP
ncbi:hypothetical protein V6N13_118427 [Hibiscus sabdariffa]